MRLLFLAPTFEEDNGWGRYAAGFLRAAKAGLGDGNVVAAGPERLRSCAVRWKTPLLAVRDRDMMKTEAEGVDLIHAAAETLAPLALLLSLATGKPYVVSAHGTYADMRTYRWYVRWLYRAAFARASAIVPVSAYTERLVRRQFPGAETAVIPGGFTPRGKAEKRGHAGFRVLSVGALKPRKGFHTLIDAFGRLGGNATLDIVGDDSKDAYAGRLKAMVAERGLEPDVRLHGRVSQDALDALYAEADLFVLPSEHEGTAFEGLGLVYLEALSHGVPAIGSRDSGAEDVIRDGENGFLVEPGNAEWLAELIGRIRSDGDLRRRLSGRADASVDGFRWENVGKRMLDLYASCVDTA